MDNAAAASDGTSSSAVVCAYARRLRRERFGADTPARWFRASSSSGCATHRLSLRWSRSAKTKRALRPAVTSRMAGLARHGRREGDGACRSSSGGRSTAPVRARSAASTQRALLAARLTTSALAVDGAALSFPAAPPVPTVAPVPSFFKCSTTHRQDTQKTPPRSCAPGRPSFAEPPSPPPRHCIPPAPRCSVLAQKVP